ncbi:MAG: hypothetical protein EA364_03335, partial [Balneolaceae bacterium]
MTRESTTMAKSAYPLFIGILITLMPGILSAQWDPSPGQPGVTSTGINFVRSVYYTDTHLYIGGSFTEINGVEASGIVRFDGTVWEAMNEGISTSGAGGSLIFEYDYGDGNGPILHAGGGGGLAKWDGEKWVSTGVNGLVWTHAVYDDGNGETLYIGGNFIQASGKNIQRLARWNKATSQWDAVGSGVDGPVIDMQVWDDGTGEALYMGGNFNNCNGSAFAYVCRMRGTEFEDVGGGMATGNHGLSIPSIRTFIVYDDGTGEKLYAGGQFGQAGGVEARFIATWDGTAWAPVANGFNNPVHSLAIHGNSDFEFLYAGGRFSQAISSGSMGRVARWDGNQWNALYAIDSLSQGVNSIVEGIGEWINGDDRVLVVGGQFSGILGDPFDENNPSIPASRIAFYRELFGLPYQPPLTGNVITTTADGGPGSLRSMIELTNSEGALGDTIKFNIPGTGPHRILLDTPLPDITRRVVIDGTTQFGYSNGVPAVIIDGSNLKTGDNGLNFTNTAVAGMLNVVKGLSIVGFTSEGIQGGAAIRLVSDFNVLISNYIGIEPDGTPNGNGYGVLVSNGSSNRIGVTTSDGNVISNNIFGIEITGANAGSNTVRGNLIGTNPAGTEAAGNLTNVRIRNASNNDIGGSSINHRNIISGAEAVTGLQHGWGIELFGSAQNPAAGNTIRNNFIGTDVTGTQAIPNQNAGLNLTSNTIGNTIGGALTDWNLISGQNVGVRLSNTATENLVAGNRIGTTADGTSALGNTTGISIQASGNEIGAPGAGNVISGNTRGILISSGTGTVIRSNFIGTTLDGNAPLPNDFGGIAIMTADNQIGGPNPGDGNVISGNTRHGIEISNTSPGNNQITGNRIGLNAFGNAALPNSWSGIQVSAQDNHITGNVISGNLRHGIETEASGTNNTITENSIGTNVAGLSAISNAQYGINLSSS